MIDVIMGILTSELFVAFVAGWFGGQMAVTGMILMLYLKRDKIIKFLSNKLMGGMLG